MSSELAYFCTDKLGTRSILYYMNHFELYNIPVAFQVDQAVLKEKLSGFEKHSGGEHSGGSTEEQEARLEQAKKAYTVLSDEEQTLKYVLQIRNQLEDRYEPDPEFQMEVRDVNEELMELELDERKELLMDVEQKATHLILKIYDDVAEIIQTYRADTGTEEELLQVKEFYYKKKYLQRILDKIRVIRNIASPQ